MKVVFSTPPHNSVHRPTFVKNQKNEGWCLVPFANFLSIYNKAKLYLISIKGKCSPYFYILFT